MSSRLIRSGALRYFSSEVPRKDITRLRTRHNILASGGIPPVELESEKERCGQRARFGKFGLRSEVDMHNLWPTVEEVEEEYALGSFTDFNSAVSSLKSSQAIREEKIALRLSELEKKMAKYPAALKKYEAGQVKAEKERDEKEVALEKRIREIQEYFGYWMDPKDPRFEVMLEQKEQEEKKAEKMAKRLESQKKKIAEII